MQLIYQRVDTLLYDIYCDVHVDSSFKKGCRKCECDNPKGIAGGVEFTEHSSKKFERMARETIDICLPVLKESNKSRFNNAVIRNSVLIISHITFTGLSHVHFLDNLSQNSRMYLNKK